MKKEIYFAGGCFWGVEKYFSLIEGVTETEVGYANGNTENPSYEAVCRYDTGHAETVRVTYNPDKVTLPFLMEMYFDVIDPTTLNRQAHDIGTQYRTGIYYTDETDYAVIETALRKLQGRYRKPVVVELKKLENYYPAEEYHQKYLDKNPGGYCHIGGAKFESAKSRKPGDRA